MLRVAIEFQCPGNYLQTFYPIFEELPQLSYEVLGTPPGGRVDRGAGPP